MSRMCQRSELEQEKRTYLCGDRVTVLGLTYGQYDQVIQTDSEEDEGSRERQETVNLPRIVEKPT